MESLPKSQINFTNSVPAFPWNKLPQQIASMLNLGPSHGSIYLPVSATTCRLAYLTALATGAVVASHLRLPNDSLWTALYANLAATLVVFFFSVTVGNSSVYDPYWTVTPQILTLWWLFSAQTTSTADITWPTYAAITTIWIWATVFHLTIPWQGWTTGLTHEDWRYAAIRKKITGTEGGSSAAYWTVSLVSFHLTPTLLVFSCLAPVGRLILETRPSSDGGGPWAVAAVAVTLVSIVVEATADYQLRCHRRDAFVEGRTGDTCVRGLWRYSRHPNYFGEVGFHAGLFLQGWANGVASPTSWSVVPTVVMVVFFRFASLPLMDGRSMERRKDYAEIMATTSALLPWPVRNVKAL